VSGGGAALFELRPVDKDDPKRKEACSNADFERRCWRGDLTNEQWRYLGRCCRPSGRRPVQDNRRFLDGMIYVLRIPMYVLVRRVSLRAFLRGSNSAKRAKDLFGLVEKFGSHFAPGGSNIFVDLIRP
jgi:hypothetical protein